MLDAALRGGGHCGTVLGQPFAGHLQGIGADEDQAIHAGKSVPQRFRSVAVGGAHLHALRLQVDELFRGSAGRHDVFSSPAQQFLDDGAAQLAVGSGDQETIIDVVHCSFSLGKYSRAIHGGCR